MLTAFFIVLATLRPSVALLKPFIIIIIIIINVLSMSWRFCVVVVVVIIIIIIVVVIHRRSGEDSHIKVTGILVLPFKDVCACWSYVWLT